MLWLSLRKSVVSLGEFTLTTKYCVCTSRNGTDFYELDVFYRQPSSHGLTPPPNQIGAMVKGGFTSLENDLGQYSLVHNVERRVDFKV